MTQNLLNNEFARAVYNRLLSREPDADELAVADGIIQQRGERAFVLLMCAMPAVPNQHLDGLGKLFVPPGHFYSPIVDSDALVRSGFFEQIADKPLPGIALEPGHMFRTFGILARHFSSIDFPEVQQESHRYYFQNDFYSYGDAIILSAIIREYRPKQIIEVGSGFSSAVILDTLDSAGLDTTVCIFIEPYPDRLHALLRSPDHQRVKILEQPIQDVPLEVFSHLDAGDLLFLDTTHISKTGSDVNFELFEVLPALKPGVLLHFHDIFWPLEYPRDWIVDQNRSWNEIYILRAFLMHNDNYKILYFNQFFNSAFQHHVRSMNPLISRNCGGGLWLRKT